MVLSCHGGKPANINHAELEIVIRELGEDVCEVNEGGPVSIEGDHPSKVIDHVDC